MQNSRRRRNPTRDRYVRKDLFDDTLDVRYRNTHANSPIGPPTFYPEKSAAHWKSRAEASLNSFQREPKRGNQLNKDQPNNPIMKALLPLVEQVKEEQLLAKLQDEVLSMIYVSDSQQRRLNNGRRGGRRYNNRRNQNNNGRVRKYHDDWYESLPGPQPYTVKRKSLERLRSNEYWVTEKSDGLRFLLLLSGTTKVYLIDRRFAFYHILHPFYRSQLCVPHKSTILDGELVLTKDNQLQFLAFDCAAIEGTSVAPKLAEHRLRCVEKCIHKYRECLRRYVPPPQRQISPASDQSVSMSPPGPQLPPPIILFQKRHYKAEEGISFILSCIEKEEKTGEYVFTERNQTNNAIIRQSFNDGIIFTPENQPYLMDFDSAALMKWKFLEKNTIDLKVKSPFFFRGELKCYAGGPRNSDIEYASVAMTDGQRRKFESLLDEMRRITDGGFVSEFVIEFALDFITNNWVPIQNRPDKNRANFITVCTDTMRVMMDNVGAQEIIQACTYRLSPDHN